MKLSDAITRPVETPSCEATEGFPLVPGFEARPSFYPGVPTIEEALVDENGEALVDETALPLTLRVRENQRIRGCNYFVNGVRSDCATVEGGLHDATRQALYRFYRRLHTLLWLSMGYTQTVPYAGQYNGDWDGANAFGVSFEFVASQVSSTVVKIRFTPGTAPDPRNLVDSLDSKPATSIMPGDCVYSFTTDGTNKTVFDQAMIRDIEWLGAGLGGYHYANLTLTRPVYVARNPNSKILIGYEKLPAPYRDVRLDGTDRCRYAKQTGHTHLTTFKIQYGGAAKAPAITSGGWYCAKWDAANFAGAACNNTTCPSYLRNSPTFHANDLGLALAARGVYVRHTIKPSQVPSGVTDLNYLWGRENWSGFLELMGFPTGWFVATLDQKTKDFIGTALFLWRTGSKVDGFDQFIRWDQKTNTDDAYPLLDVWAQYAVPDPSGGLANDMRLKSRPFDKQAYLRGPAWRCTYGEEGETAYACGWYGNGRVGNLYDHDLCGNVALQTIKRRRYTSKPFRKGVDSSALDESTHLTSYALFRYFASVTGSSLYAYKVQWQVPAFAEQVWSRKDVQTKTYPGGWDAAGEKLLPTVSAASLAGGNKILRLEFALSWDAGLYPVDGDNPDGTATWRSGGFVVQPDNARQSRNPATRYLFGDRNIGLREGDLVEFEDCPEVWLMCVGADAFAGVEDTSVGTIPAGVPDVPAWLRSNHRRRDVAYFEVGDQTTFDLPSGRLFYTWAVSVGGLSALVGKRISRVIRNAVSPPKYTRTGALSGFYPSAVKVWSASTGVLPVSPARYDPPTGTFYMQHGPAWPEGEDLYLSSEQWVFDRNGGYSCEMIHALNLWLRGICMGWLNCNITGGFTGSNGAWETSWTALGSWWTQGGNDYYSLTYYPAQALGGYDWSSLGIAWTESQLSKVVAYWETDWVEHFGVLPAPPARYKTGIVGMDLNTAIPRANYSQYDAVVGIDLKGSPLARCTSAQVWRVLFDFVLLGATVTQRTTSSRSYTGSPFSITDTIVASIPNLTFDLAYTDDFTTFTRVSGLSAAVGSGFTRIGNDFHGTIDGTRIIKYILDNDRAGRVWGMFPTTADRNGWLVAHNGKMGAPYSGKGGFSVSGYGVEYDGVYCKDAWVQIDPAHLDDAPVDFLLGAQYLQERPPALA